MAQRSGEDLHSLHGLDADAFVSALAQGDRRAWEVLDQKLHEPLCRYLWKLTGDRHVAEELCQETLVAALERLGRFKGPHLRAWLYKIARNKAQKRFRKQAKHRELAANCTSKTRPGDYHISCISLELLDRLPATLTRVIVLRFWEGYTIPEIAKALQVSIRTASRYKKEALSHLRQILKEEYKL